MIFKEEALMSRFKFHQGNLYLQDKELLTQAIYRRMSLESFKSIQERKEFYVPRKYRFSDKKEGADYITINHQFSHMGVAGHPETIPKHDDERPENLYAVVVPVSCWTQNGSDQFLRWKGYDHGGVEVMIKTTVGEFLAGLDTSHYRVYVSRVQYDQRSLNADFISLFWKSEGYTDEEEVRFCFVEEGWNQLDEKPIDDGIKLKTNSLSFIQEIWVASMSNHQKAVEAYQELRDDSVIGDLVRLSSLVENPSYQVSSLTLLQLSSRVICKLEEKRLKQPRIQLDAWKRIREWMEEPKMKSIYSKGGRIYLPIDKNAFKSAFHAAHPTPSGQLSGADDTVINLMYRVLEG